MYLGKHQKHQKQIIYLVKHDSLRGFTVFITEIVTKNC